nr:hypothetical protein Iba_chr13dCG7820 [Ipomoea batatas]
MSNCYNEEQREVYRVEQPPGRGIIGAAREWVSTRSGRISLIYCPIRRESVFLAVKLPQTERREICPSRTTTGARYR